MSLTVSSGLIISPLVGVSAKNQLNTPSPKCFEGNRDIVFTSIMKTKEVSETEKRILATQYELVQIFGGNAIDGNWCRLVLVCQRVGVGIVDSTITASRAQLFLRWHARVKNFVLLPEESRRG